VCASSILGSNAIEEKPVAGASIAFVCGRKNVPPLFETLVVLGREVCLARIKQAEEQLKSLA
jgi:hypothetical protein